MSEIVDLCLALQPVPGLSAAFKVLNHIWETSQNIQSSKERMKTLASCIAELLIALQDALKSGQVTASSIQERIGSLERYENMLGVSIHE
jgi:hypothetical protein